MASRTVNGSPRRSAGFTYLGLIILLAIMGLVAAAGIKMGTVMQRAAAEEDLLEIGAQFSAALRSYAAATPKGQPLQPPTLQELLKDPRFPNPRRHLRKIFVDPVTGKAEWGIMYLNGDKGVIGVYSLSDKRPLKIANFDARFPNFENKEKLSEWRFVMGPVAGLNAPVPPPAAQAPDPAPSPQPVRTPLFEATRSDSGREVVTIPARGAPGQPMPPPRPEPDSTEAPPAAPPEDKPLDPPEDSKDDDEDEAKPLNPPDDGRIDETKKDDKKDEDARRTDPRVPVKRPANRR